MTDDVMSSTEIVLSRWFNDPQWNDVMRRAAHDRLCLLEQDWCHEELQAEVNDRKVAKYLWELPGKHERDPNTCCVYLIAKARSNAIKVGITNAIMRLDDWESAGWDIVQVWTLRDPWLLQRSRRVALDVERSVIRYWRGECRSGYGGYPADFPFGGMTESAVLSGVSVGATQTLIDIFIESSDSWWYRCDG